MPTFPGKIGFVDDASGDMTAEITVSETTLDIASGDTSIGSWPIAEVDLVLGARGFVATLDGEQLVLSPHDRFGFTTAVEEAQEAAAQPTSRRQAKKKTKAAKKAAAEQAERDKQEAQAAAEARERAAAQAAEREGKNAKRAAKKQQKAEKKALKAARKLEATDRGEAPIHVPGLEDPDKDALWATHRTDEGGLSWRERLNSTTGRRKVLIATGVMLAIGIVFAPAAVSFLLLIPGVIAVVLAGLALLDPAYTRFLPGSFSELRLMLIGLTFFAFSLLVATLR